MSVAASYDCAASPQGGRVTPSGAGSAGFTRAGGNIGTLASPAARLFSANGTSLVRPGSPRPERPAANPRAVAGRPGQPPTVGPSSTIARGGLGVTASRGGSGSASSGGSSGS